MEFHGYEIFRTASGSCFRVTFISVGENQKSHDNFSSIFSMPGKLFYGFEE